MPKKPKEPSVVQRCLKERESTSPYQKIFQGMFHSMRYEFIMGLVNMFNIWLVVKEVDAASLNTEAPDWVGGLSTFLLLVYCGEIALRFYAFGPHMYIDAFSWLDTLLVLIDIVGLLSGDALKQFSCLRILRLGKVGRAIKLLESIPELLLMLKGLVGACKAIICGTILASIILLLWAILAVILIHPINKEIADTGYYEGCERCPRAFETVFQSLLTFSQTLVAGDAWGTLSLPIIERHPITGAFFYGVFSTVVLASMNLMLALIVDAAQGARVQSTHDLAVEREKEKAVAKERLSSLCGVLDTDDDGKITLKELQSGFKDIDEFRDVLEVLEVSEEDVPVVFGMMDRDSSGEVSYDEFLSEMFKMQTSDLQSMIVYIRFYVTQIRSQLIQRLDELQETLKKQAEKDEQILEQEMEQQKDMMLKLESEEQEMLKQTNEQTDMMHKLEAEEHGILDSMRTGFSAGDQPLVQGDIKTSSNQQEAVQTQLILNKLESLEQANATALAALQMSIADVIEQTGGASKLPEISTREGEMLQWSASKEGGVQGGKQDKLVEGTRGVWPTCCAAPANRPHKV